MTTVEICLPDHAYTRLAELANQRDVTVKQLFEQWPSAAIAEFDAEMRFRAMTIQGSREIGLSLLDQLDALPSFQVR